MVCKVCETMYPPKYEACPKCGSALAEQMKYTHKKDRTDENKKQHKVSPFVETSEVSAGEFRIG